MKSVSGSAFLDKVNVVIECVWLLIIFIIPLYFNPFTLNAFYFAKTVILVILVSIGLGLCLAQWVLSRQFLRVENVFPIIKENPVQTAVVIFGILCIISTIFSIMPYKSLWGNLAGSVGLLTYLSWIIFFLIVATKVRSTAQILRALYALLISSGLVSLIGIIQYFNPHILPWFKFAGRVFATDGNPLSLSAFLAMTLPITLAMIILNWYGAGSQRQNKKIFAGLLLLFVLQLGCLALAQYSITLLLFIIGIFSYFALIGLFLQKKATIALSIAFLILIVIIAGVLLGPMLLPGNNTVDTGSQSAAMSTAEQVGLPTLSIRVDAWKCAANIIIHSPEMPFFHDHYHWLRRIIGYGPETFIATSQAMFPSSLKSQYTFDSLVIAQPENHYLYLGVTIGILGLLAFLSILFLFFYKSLKVLFRSHDRGTVTLISAFIAAIFQYCIHILFNASVIGPELVFWTVMGLAVALSKFADIKAGHSNAVSNDLLQKNAWVIKKERLLKLITAIVIVIIFGVTGIMLTLNPLIANMKIQSGLTLFGKDKNATLVLYQDAARIEPKQSYYSNFVGNMAYLMAQEEHDIDRKAKLLNISEAAYLNAVEQEPQMAIWRYRLADIYTYWTMNGDKSKYDDAVKLYEDAIRLFPGNAVILNKWAFSSILNEDYTLAETKLNEAQYGDPKWIQTAFYKGLASAAEGDVNEAGRLLISKTSNPYNDIRYFVNFCSLVANYGKAILIQESLQAELGTGKGEWLDYTFLAVADVYCGDFNEAVEAFQDAADLVSDENRYLLAGTIRASFSGNEDYQKEGQNIIDQLVNKIVK